MGCDIHMYGEVRRQGRWQPLLPARLVTWSKEDREAGKQEWPALYSDRNYNVFGILANVRNGSGFAGIETGAGFVPISDPRGLPEDLSDEYRAAIADEDDSKVPRLWFGDHSETHLSLKELIDFDWTQTTACAGVVNAVGGEQCA